MAGNFIRVKSSIRPRGGNRRKGAMVRIDPTGLTDLSIDASEIGFKLAVAAGATRKEFVVWYGVDAAKGAVAVYFEKPGTEGATMPRLSADGKYISLHLGPVFDEHLSLQPATAVRALCMEDVDQSGRKVLSIALKGAMERRATHREGTGKSEEESE